VVKIGHISKEIARQLEVYTSSIEEEIELAKEVVTKEAVKLLQENSPELTGDYAKGWKRKKVGKDIVVHNKTDYQLTHLLEYGHAKAEGGRVQAKVHIRPVEEKIVNDFEERVERMIKQ
jgi:hypothetical protein